MPEPRVVKRYANRKLYDTESSRYVTLEEIGELVRGGTDVRIIDNTTKEDLTSVTLAQVLVEKNRKKGLVPLDSMRGLLQSGGESLHQLADQLRDAKGKVGERVGHTVEDWQRRADERMRAVIEGLSPLSGLQKEVQILSARVEELEKEIERLKKGV